MTEHNLFPPVYLQSRSMIYRPSTFSGSNESQREAESKSSQQAKRRKERQQQYEQKRKRSFQKKWIKEFDRMVINKYRPGQNKHITLMQSTKWST